MSRIRNYWLGLSIGSKMRVFILLLLLVVSIAVGFNMYTIQFSVGDVNRILREIAQCEDAQDAMLAEEDAFRLYVRNPSEENLKALNQSITHSEGTLSLLPFDYQEIGAERYARTWRVKNAYSNYSLMRNSISSRLATYNSAYNVAIALEDDENMVDRLYEVYDMQAYLDGYL